METVEGTITDIKPLKSKKGFPMYFLSIDGMKEDLSGSGLCPAHINDKVLITFEKNESKGKTYRNIKNITNVAEKKAKKEQTTPDEDFKTADELTDREIVMNGVDQDFRDCLQRVKRTLGGRMPEGEECTWVPSMFIEFNTRMKILPFKKKREAKEEQ